MISRRRALPGPLGYRAGVLQNGKALVNVAAGTVALSASTTNYVECSRAGVVTKLSQKGLVWDSCEGEMLMALPADSGITTPEKFLFSVKPTDTATVAKLQALRDIVAIPGACERAADFLVDAIAARQTPAAIRRAA